MPNSHYLVNQRNPELVFRILGFDKARGVIKLRGRFGELEQPFDKEALKRAGFIVKECPDAQFPQLQA